MSLPTVELDSAVEDRVEDRGVFAKVGKVVVRFPWAVIGLWIAMAIVLPQVFPSLGELAQKMPASMLPANAPSVVSAQEMAKAYNEASSENMLLVVISNDNGLTPADEARYGQLITKLRADTKDVAGLQDFVSTPPLREVLASKNGKAWLLPINVTGTLGSPDSTAAYHRIAEIVKQSVAAPTVATLTGPAATLNDINEIGEKDRIFIEAGTAIMLFLILLIIYRNPLTMLLPLITIGVSLMVAQGAVAALGTLGLSISNQTIVLLSAMMAGAGTDYAVFLISRYHDYLRMGEHSDDAVKSALTSVGKVIAASAATVAVTFLGMVFTTLTVFSTVGFALATAIFVGLVGAVTFLPAVLVLAGRRGWCKPRKDLTSQFWRRAGIRIVRKPRSHLIVSLIILALLAGCVGLAKYNYDDRKTLPQAVESIHGYDVIGQHFPANTSLPQYLLVHSQQDLRSPEALADLENMAYRVSQIPNIDIVRGITRPTGESLEQARLSFQSGEIGSRINEAVSLIQDHDADLSRLTGGADQVADALGMVRGQVEQGLSSVGGLVQALTYIQQQLGGNKTLKDLDQAGKLVDAMHALGGAIDTNLNVAQQNFKDSIDPLLRGLDGSPVCDSDPACINIRDQFRQLAIARDNGTLDKIFDLAKQLQATDGAQSLGAVAKQLSSALNAANTALKSSGLGTPGAVQSRMNQLREGTRTLADASRAVADGVQLLVDQTRKLGVGLNEASKFLLAMKRDANTQTMAGFYIPPQFLTSEDFTKAAGIFISPDGHYVRYLIQSKLNPFSPEAMDQVDAIVNTARQAQPNTLLEGAQISINGYSVTLRDIRQYYNQDFRFIVICTILVVLLILIGLLRALVAPLYLMFSVVVSYLSALGIGILTFQILLHQEIHWSVPGLTFIILVAVGADYNLLLISRIRDESPYGIRSGVIRTVTQTGGVITSAGLIFAASMLGLLFASLTTIVQIGFIIGVGILLDTFLVRTITVPAIAVVVGKANWWPSRGEPPPPPKRKRAAQQAGPEQTVAVIDAAPLTDMDDRSESSNREETADDARSLDAAETETAETEAAETETVETQPAEVVDVTESTESDDDSGDPDQVDEDRRP